MRLKTVLMRANRGLYGIDDTWKNRIFLEIFFGF